MPATDSNFHNPVGTIRVNGVKVATETLCVVRGLAGVWIIKGAPMPGEPSAPVAFIHGGDVATRTLRELTYLPARCDVLVEDTGAIREVRRQRKAAAAKGGAA